MQVQHGLFGQLCPRLSVFGFTRVSGRICFCGSFRVGERAAAFSCVATWKSARSRDMASRCFDHVDPVCLLVLGLLAHIQSRRWLGWMVLGGLSLPVEDVSLSLRAILTITLAKGVVVGLGISVELRSFPPARLSALPRADAQLRGAQGARVSHWTCAAPDHCRSFP